MAIGIVKLERQTLRGGQRFYLPAVIAGMLIATRARSVGGLRDRVVPPNVPVEPMGWRPYYGSIEKTGTAGGTGIGQPLRSAPYDDDAPPNPELFRGGNA